MTDSPNFLDLFAGAGGLSEGFMRAGYTPVAHVEADTAACNTLKTRMSYYWLKKHGKLDTYYDYLMGALSREHFYDLVPASETASVINAIIGKESLSAIFRRIDDLLKGKTLDLIIGGPPCQAYSLVGRARDKNGMKEDERNYLYIYYAEFLKRYKPRYFLFENVTGLLSAKSPDGTRYFDSMRNLFRDVGYETEYKTLSAENYGVLQTRKRIFLVGKRGYEEGFYPHPEKWSPDVTVNEILDDLPPLQAGKGSLRPCLLKNYSGLYLKKSYIRKDDLHVTMHAARPHTEQDLEIYRIAVNKWNKHRERLDYNDLPENLKTHKNCKSFTDRFKVVAGDLSYSQTVVAHIAKDGHYYIHPDIKQNRSLTPREAARIQTFPDDYFFESGPALLGRTAPYRQIGNAVPVLLAYKIAQKLIEVW